MLLLARITAASLSIGMGFLISACGSKTAYMAMNVPPHPVKARPPTEVQMFTTSKPARSFVEIGMITSTKSGGQFSGASEFDLLNGVREEAAKQGCDGVVVTDENKMAAGGYNSVGSYSAVESAHGFRAVCIVYND